MPIVAGFLSGALVLGCGGRLVMWLFAVIEELPGIGFTLGGTVAVVVTGALYGGVAGLIYIMVERCGVGRVARIGMVASGSFLFAAIVGKLLDQVSASALNLPLALGMFGLLVVAHVWVFDGWVVRARASVQRHRPEGVGP